MSGVDQTTSHPQSSDYSNLNEISNWDKTEKNCNSFFNPYFVPSGLLFSINLLFNKKPI